MDKSFLSTPSLLRQAKTITAPCEDRGYADVWKAQHPNDRVQFLQMYINCIDFFICSKNIAAVSRFYLINEYYVYSQKPD